MNVCIGSIGRIWAITLQYTRQMFRNTTRTVQFFYWPLLDVLLFGYLALWVQRDIAGSESVFAISILTSLVLWQLLVRVNFDVALSLLSDIDERNITNVFSSPLSISEWVIGVMLLAVTRQVILGGYCIALVWLVFGVNVLQSGWYLIPLYFVLLLVGLALGLFSTSVLLYGGRNITPAMYMIGWMFSPMTSVFYPINVLPSWLMIVAKCLPYSYLFGSIRVLIMQGYVPLYEFTIGTTLAIFYLIMTMILFRVSFRLSLNRGLARLSD